ncbi:hypothetical protein [Lacticaseibacillus parakribbianus]|uniref:hypothetical protein n=1 Tax=Lacticaseibacillus parakribbianus TaxID=2970927 RepID=UPI0021CAF46A|nr:hypothetical protein [Lacticaseibacillus parakribbianus]
MFKTSKEFIKSATQAATAFNDTIKNDPEILVPLALVHVIPIALTIVGGTQICLMHQRLKIEREHTKQVRLRAELHRGHCEAGKGGHCQHHEQPVAPKGQAGADLPTKPHKHHHGNHHEG